MEQTRGAFDKPILCWFCPSCVTAAFVVGLTAAALSADEVDYDRAIQPLLMTRCCASHGPDQQESGLRLDIRRRRPRPLAGATVVCQSCLALALRANSFRKCHRLTKIIGCPRGRRAFGGRSEIAASLCPCGSSGHSRTCRRIIRRSGLGLSADPAPRWFCLANIRFFDFSIWRW
jgi:hypothetical protein